MFIWVLLPGITHLLMPSNNLPIDKELLGLPTTWENYDEHTNLAFECGIKQLNDCTSSFQV